MMEQEGRPVATTANLEMIDLPEVARLLLGMGASKVFVFGSAARGSLRDSSDLDIAVAGLPASVYFSAVSKASDLVGRAVDLVDLDDESPLVRHLLQSGELVRVG